MHRVGLSSKESPRLQQANKSSVFNYKKGGIIDSETKVELSINIPAAEDENAVVYGICGSANGEIIVTDGEKVKIKIFGSDGKLQNSYGTPTWPRFGRGITKTGNGGEFAVCHLSEVCVYSEDGKPIDRYMNEEFWCCWGIAKDMDGNFAVTDIKHSCVYILNRQGDIIEKIGGKIAKPNITKEKSKTKIFNFRKKKNPDSSKVSPIQPLNEGMNQLGEIVTPKHIRLNDRVRMFTPRYVVFNSRGQMLVTDTSQRCLLVFNADNTFAFTIGGGYKGCSSCGSRDSMYSSSIGTQSTDTTPMKRMSWIRRYSRALSFSTTDSKSSGDLEWDEIVKSRNNSPSRSKRRGSQPPSKSTFMTMLKNIKRTKSASVPMKKEDAVIETSVPVEQKLRNHSEETIGSSVADLPSCSSTRSPYKIDNRGDMTDVEDAIRGSSVADFPSCSTTRSPYGITALDVEDEIRGSSVSDLPSCSTRSPYKIDKGDGITSSQSMNVLWRRRNQTSDMPRARSTDVIVETQFGRGDAIQEECQDEENEEVFVEAFNQPQCDVWVNRRPHKLSMTKSKSDSDNWQKHFDGPSCSTSNYLSDRQHRIGRYSDKELDDYSIFTVLKDREEEGESDDGDMFERDACRECHVTDPRGVAVDADDNILLADASKNRVTLFNQTGHFIRHLLTEEDVKEPKAICLLPNNKLAVADASKKIKIYDLINMNLKAK